MWILSYEAYGGQNKYGRIHIHRYCTGYKKTSHGFRNFNQCGDWVRKVDPEARFFFFRTQSNWHCSPCPLYYKGDTRYTAQDFNTRIHIYRILNWTAPKQKWHDKAVRVAYHRYCTGYKKTMTHCRTVSQCAEWVRNVDPNARWFFFRR
jgi:hypothetical protein